MTRAPRALAFAAALVALAACDPPQTQPATTAAAPADETLARIRKQAEELEPLLESALAKDFVRATASLPPVRERVLHHDAGGRWLTGAQLAALPPAERAGFEEERGGSDLFYETHYGSPLAYARAIDLAAKAGLASVAGKRVLDFGYGTAGHLRLLAALGAEAVGVDVDPFLVALYSQPGDRGAFGKGRVGMVNGRFPADAKVRAAIGANYTLFVSKNTLKNGYIHPAEPVPPKQAFDLGVSDADFVAAVKGALAPGGLFLVYNVSPKPAGPGEKYKPWADGRCPFSRATLEAAGFDVLAFDQDDGPAMRRVGKVLRWDEEMKADLETEVFALYTLARRR
jgi:SAM-dependent methyltransferase